MQAAEKAAMPRRSAIDQEGQPGTGAQDPGAQRSVPGSAQPHRLADLSRSKSPHSESTQGLAAQGDRGIEGGGPQGHAARADEPRSAHELRPDGRAASGLEGREGRAAAEARGRDEARPPSCAPQRDKYLSDRIADASTDTIAGGAELARQASTSASARFTSRMSIWWTAANPATWARASRST